MDSNIPPSGGLPVILLNAGISLGNKGSGISINWDAVPFEIILGVGLCVLLSFSVLILAGAERALFSFSPGDLENLNQRSKRAYSIFQKYLEQPKLLSASIQLLHTLLSAALVIILTYISLQVTASNTSVWWPFIPEIFLVALWMVLLVNVIPNALAEKHNVAWTILLLPGLSLFYILIRPFAKLMLYSEKKVDETVSNLTESDINELKQDTESDTPTREEQEVQLLKGVMKFGSIQVKQIMRPRPDVVALNEATPFDEAIKVIKESGYSRIPVYRQTLDNIIGILYTKDLLAFLQNGADKNWNKLIREAFFVPEGKKIAELLIEFQTKMIHMAVVIDEYGSTAGIVTLEDILEEIIGEIRDESDDKTEMDVTKVDDHTYIFEGKTLLNDVYKVMGIKNFPFDDIKGDVESIGGLVMELSGKMPEEKEQLQYKNYRFEILAVDKHRVKKVKVVHQTEEE